MSKYDELIGEHVERDGLKWQIRSITRPTVDHCYEIRFEQHDELDKGGGWVLFITEDVLDQGIDVTREKITERLSESDPKRRPLDYEKRVVIEKARVR